MRPWTVAATIVVALTYVLRGRAGPPSAAIARAVAKRGLPTRSGRCGCEQSYGGGLSWPGASVP